MNVPSCCVHAIQLAWRVKKTERMRTFPTFLQNSVHFVEEKVAEARLVWWVRKTKRVTKKSTTKKKKLLVRGDM